MVIGLSGNIRIHILPPRRAQRVIARRPASICLDVTQAGSRALRANLPKQIWLPRADTPFILPRCCLRYLVPTGLQSMIPQYLSLLQNRTRGFTLIRLLMNLSLTVEPLGGCSFYVVPIVKRSIILIVAGRGGIGEPEYNYWLQ